MPRAHAGDPLPGVYTAVRRSERTRNQSQRVWETRLLEIPGLHCPKWFNGQIPAILDSESTVQLPEEAGVEALKARFETKTSPAFAYVKLHGSFGWVRKDRSDVMVIGHTKTEMIKREPLLCWYLELFREVLRNPGRNLVVIGYGFGDDHINEIIADAVRNSGRRLFLISPLDPKDFRDRLIPIHGFNVSIPNRGEDLWNGLGGYYRGTVTDFYCPTSSRLPERGKMFLADLGLS